MGKPPKTGKDLAPSLAPEKQAELDRLLDQIGEVLATGDSGRGVRALLATAPPGDLAWDLALITALGKLPQEAVAQALYNHFSFCTDKTRKKALKKALHHLQALGVVLPDAARAPAGPSLIRPLAGGRVAAHLSPIDGTGSRMLVLQLPSERFGFNALIALINDTQGLNDCYGATVSKKAMQEVLAQAEEQARGKLVAASPAYCFRLLEDAYALAPDRDGAVYYRPLRDRLAQLPDLQLPPLLEDLLPPLDAAAADTLREQSQDLATEEAIMAWMPANEELEPLVPRVREVLNSPLVLSEAQKKDRLDDILRQAAQEFYPPSQRPLLVRRLQDMAYYFDLRGRPHQARLAQAAAADLERPRSDLEEESPFLLDLIILPLGLFLGEEEAPPADQGSGLILPPESPLVLR